MANQSTSTSRARHACALLFGPNTDVRLGSLDIGTLKRAYRARVFECHPDRAVAVGGDEASLSARTAEVNRAYEALLNVVKSCGVAAANVGGTARAPKSRPEYTQASQHRRRANRPHARTGGPGSQCRTDTRRQRTTDGTADAGRKHWRRASDNSQSAASEGSRTSASGDRREAKTAPPRYAEHAEQENAPPRVGGLPHRQLKFGRFLYYSGLIEWSALVDAVAWQASSRTFFGELAVDMGYLTRSQLTRLLFSRRNDAALGSYAVAQGLMTDFQRLVILGKQRTAHQPLGKYFVERGLFNMASLSRALSAQGDHNRRFGA